MRRAAAVARRGPQVGPFCIPRSERRCKVWHQHGEAPGGRPSTPAGSPPPPPACRGKGAENSTRLSANVTAPPRRATPPRHPAPIAESGGRWKSNLPLSAGNRPTTTNDWVAAGQTHAASLPLLVLVDVVVVLVLLLLLLHMQEAQAAISKDLIMAKTSRAVQPSRAGGALRKVAVGLPLPQPVTPLPAAFCRNPSQSASPSTLHLHAARRVTKRQEPCGE